MSPSFSAARPFWVWSLPAFAVLLSLLWYRKKRGSLKTDSGGAGETRNDKKSVESSDEEESPVSEKKSDLKKSGVFDKVIEGIKLKAGGEEEVKEEEEEEEVVEEIINSVKIIDKVESAKPPAAVLENFIKPLIKDSLNSYVVDDTKEGIINLTDLTKSGNQTEEQEIIILRNRVVEESVLPNQDEDKIEEIIEENRNQEEIQVFKSGKCGKKKKMKNSSKKLHDSKPDAVKQGKEENTACILEKKLAKLELEKQCSNNNNNNNNTSGNNKKMAGVNSSSNNNGGGGVNGKANNMKANNNNNNDKASEGKERNSNSNSNNSGDDFTERDSANNSPSEVMLASPSVSGYSDTHSEVIITNLIIIIMIIIIPTVN